MTTFRHIVGVIFLWTALCSLPFLFIYWMRGLSRRDNEADDDEP